MSQFASQFYTGRKLAPVYPGGKQMTVVLAPNGNFLKGTVLGQITSAAASSVQTLSLTGTPTGGTFTITYNGQTTAAIPYNATGAQVQAALVLLSNIGPGQVLCTGGALPGTGVICTFAGLMASLPVIAMTVTASLTGGSSPAAAFAQTTTGVANGKYAAYASGNTDGTQHPVCLLEFDCVTSDRGNIIFGVGVTNPEWTKTFTTGAYFKGEFNCAELVGLDANALGILGRLVIGASATDPNAVISLN